MKTKEAEALESQKTQVAKIIPIRTETVLCQYPIHKLSKEKGTVQIHLTQENGRGKVETTWEVSANAKYGHPGILAYKLDTLVINQLIDELYPDIPEVIKIANSLRELSVLIGKESTGDTAKVKNALYQNAFAAITARLEFTGKDRKQRRFEFGSTRYGVVFTGERLPNGETADAIYIVLNPLFRDVLQNAKRRPLDYQYLKELPPSAQRWYELVSFQIFAALNRGNSRARYLYSELCKRAPITRFWTWEQAKKQLYKIHRPHIESGYISKFNAEETADEGGRLDWVLWYTPGQKAQREYQEFNDRPQKTQTPPLRPQLVMLEESREVNTPKLAPEDSSLIEKLMSFGVDENRASRLVDSDRAECEVWAAAWPHQNQKGMENPPAVLISFIETKRRPLPKGYQTAVAHEERRRKHEEEQERARAEETYFQFFEPAFNQHQRQELSAIEESSPKAYAAFQAHFDKHHAKGSRMITGERQREKFMLSKAAEFFELKPEHGVRLSTFEEWDEAHNAERLDPLNWFNRDPQGIFDELDRRLSETESACQGSALNRTNDMKNFRI